MRFRPIRCTVVPLVALGCAVGLWLARRGSLGGGCLVWCVLALLGAPPRVAVHRGRRRVTMKGPMLGDVSE